VTCPLVSVIGPPAVGKTTLAEALARALPAEVIYEDYAGNPFLAEAYLGRDDLRLPAQLYYLFSRVGQLAMSRWPADGLRVSDYGFCQDRLYATAQLAGEELHVYDRVARQVESLVKPPDVLVLLDADEDTLLKRIAARGREFERTFTRQFLTRMRQAYRALPAAAGGDVIEIDCARTDVREDAAAVAEKVREAL
jgi:deoxyadenosine/deoxycytidine kinase